MSWESDVFVCSYCGKEIEGEPIKIALHIKDNHETSRGTLSSSP